MEISNYHRLSQDNITEIAQILSECFQADPLYCKLLPDEHLRKKILKEIFECDAEEMFNYCDVVGDSDDVKGIMIFTDSTEKRSAMRKYLAEKLYAFKTNLMLIKNDWSLKTLFRFFRCRKYLISKWATRLEPANQLHIIYLAVKKEFHGQGIAHKLLAPVFEYADNNDIMVTLETHNKDNVQIYEHYGFEMYEEFATKIGLKQYCLVRKPNVQG